MAAVSVRPARPTDAAGVRAVARASLHAAYDPIVGAERVAAIVETRYVPATLRRAFAAEDRPFLVAARDDSVVGFASARSATAADGTVDLRRCYVRPDAWGEGVGSKLLQGVEAVARSRGLERARLAVLDRNERASRFFESHDYRRVERADGGPDGADQVVYRKDL